MSDIFYDIVGHDYVKRGLIHAAQTERMHHAFLFTGPAGIGKAMLGRAFIQAILCESSTSEAYSRCGHCSNCHRIDNKIHPDVLEIDESSASIKIEVIRDLQKRLIYPPFESPRRFVIIHDVHKMQDAAANCLLKTLEEPEAHTTFILLTSQIQRLLPTIVSRCQVVRFAPFTMDEIKGFLIQRGVDPDSASQIAALASGSLGTALELSASDYRIEVLNAFEEMLSPDSTLDAFSIASALKGKKNMADHLLSLLGMFIRDMLVLKTASDSRILLEHYRSKMMARLPKTELKDLYRASAVVQEVSEAFQGNVNELVAWERLMIGLHGVLF